MRGLECDAANATRTDTARPFRGWRWLRPKAGAVSPNANTTTAVSAMESELLRALPAFLTMNSPLMATRPPRTKASPSRCTIYHLLVVVVGHPDSHEPGQSPASNAKRACEQSSPPLQDWTRTDREGRRIERFRFDRRERACAGPWSACSEVVQSDTRRQGDRGACSAGAMRQCGSAPRRCGHRSRSRAARYSLQQPIPAFPRPQLVGGDTRPATQVPNPHPR